jgi:hypothetical protein
MKSALKDEDFRILKASKKNCVCERYSTIGIPKIFSLVAATLG